MGVGREMRGGVLMNGVLGIEGWVGGQFALMSLDAG